MYAIRSYYVWSSLPSGTNLLRKTLGSEVNTWKCFEYGNRLAKMKIRRMCIHQNTSCRVETVLSGKVLTKGARNELTGSQLLNCRPLSLFHDMFNVITSYSIHYTKLYDIPFYMSWFYLFKSRGHTFNLYLGKTHVVRDKHPAFGGRQYKFCKSA